MKKSGEKGNLKNSVLIEKIISFYEVLASLFIILFDKIVDAICVIVNPIKTRVYMAYRKTLDKREEKRILKIQELIEKDIEEQISLAKEIIAKELNKKEEIEVIEEIPKVEEHSEKPVKKYSFFKKEAGKHAKETEWRTGFTLQAACAMLIAAVMIIVTPTQSVFSDYVYSVSNVEMGDWGKPVITLEGISPMTIIVRK